MKKRKRLLLQFLLVFFLTGLTSGRIFAVEVGTGVEFVPGGQNVTYTFKVAHNFSNITVSEKIDFGNVTLTLNSSNLSAEVHSIKSNNILLNLSGSGQASFSSVGVDSGLSYYFTQRYAQHSFVLFPSSAWTKLYTYVYAAPSPTGGTSGVYTAEEVAAHVSADDKVLCEQRKGVFWNGRCYTCGSGYVFSEGKCVLGREGREPDAVEDFFVWLQSLNQSQVIMVALFTSLGFVGVKLSNNKE